jgi:hypothetical protein
LQYKLAEFRIHLCLSLLKKQPLGKIIGESQILSFLKTRILGTLCFWFFFYFQFLFLKAISKWNLVGLRWEAEEKIHIEECIQ